MIVRKFGPKMKKFSYWSLGFRSCILGDRVVTEPWSTTFIILRLHVGLWFRTLSIKYLLGARIRECNFMSANLRWCTFWRMLLSAPTPLGMGQPEGLNSTKLAKDLQKWSFLSKYGAGAFTLKKTIHDLR